MSGAFHLLLKARHKLYETGILPTFRLNHPVISVGNLTVGGTGKTPLVIALAEAFHTRGFHPVILSRGYKRTRRGVLVVGDNGWEEVGDEPYLMAKRLRNVPVVVGADRYQAGVLAQRKNLGDLFILDDAFQHRRLHRDVDIVTVDPVEWLAGESLLPAGPWREPKTAISRAHIACVYQPRAEAPLPLLPIPSFVVETRVDGIYGDDDRPVGLEAVKGRAIVAFAGIAKPERFFSTLESMGIQPAKRVRFRDHRRFSRRDIEKLNGEIRITTEKDAVRLRGSGFHNFLWLRVSANIPEFDRLLDEISIKGSLPKR